MDPLATVWFGLLAVSLFLIITDESIAEFVYLTIGLLWINIKKRYYMVILHPYNPITNWLMERKTKKMADDLCREMKIGDYAPKSDKALDDKFNYDTSGK